MTEVTPEPTPETFGRYRLLKMAGAGGMAQVHLAHQLGPNNFIKPCVLKRISSDHADDERVRQMFLEEARVTALLNHPNVVHTIDFGEVEAVPFIAMELVDGVNLAQLLKAMAKKDRWIAISPAVGLCRKVLEALHYAHELMDLEGRPLNLIHRDVSPQNILLSRVGEVKLADFGIARHDAREEATLGYSPKGKPGYMAPEQAMGAAIDHRVDLFALGIVLVELLSARRVLKPGTPIAGLFGMSARIEELLATRGDIPPELRSLALRLTAMEPDQRPGSAVEAIRMLDAAAESLTPPDLSGFLQRTLNRYFPRGAGAPIDPLSSNISGKSAVEVSGPTSPATETPDPPQDPPINTLLTNDLSLPPPDPTPQPESLPEDRPRLTLPKPGGEAMPELDKPAGLQTSAGEEPMDLSDALMFTDDESSSTNASMGWPAQFSGKGDLRIVKGRSSAMEHMDQFGAQHSEEAQKRGADPNVDKPAPAPAYNPGKGALISVTDDKLDQVLADVAEEDKAKPEERGFSLPPIVPLALAGAAVVALGLGLIAAFMPGEGSGPKAPTSGKVLVSSKPPGAQILIDGQPTQKRTPAEIENLPLDQPFKIAVRKEGFLAIPKVAALYIQRDSPETAASFTLKRGRVYRLVTKPAGALVVVNGHRLPDITPLSLDPIPFGETASIAVTLEGHIPARLVLTADAKTATVARLELEPGRRVDISSSPSGAKVTIDGEAKGTTPLYDVLIPDKRRVRIRVSKRGYRRWSKRVAGARLEDVNLVAELSPVPLLSMPGMSREERKEARRLDLLLSKDTRTLRSLKRKIAASEKRLEKVQSERRMFVSDVTQVQSQVDRLRAQQDEVEQRLEETKTAIETFRERIQLRLDRRR